MSRSSGVATATASGLSQYGARGRALAGQLAPEILAHYYAKTTLGTTERGDAGPGPAPDRPHGDRGRPLTVVGLVGGWTIDGIATTFPASAKLTLAPTATGATTWNLKVVSATGAVLATKVVSGDLYVRPINASSVLQLVSKATTTNVYRGFFRIRLTTTALVVNHIGVDQYLRGVVPLEMPSTWPTEALRAQAIAARSYALYRVHPATGLFDVYDDTRSQVYRGKRVETSATNAAISATAGTVLLSGTALVNALFHSADGGWTENNENVFVEFERDDRGGRGLVPAGVDRPRPGRDVVRPGLALRDLEDGDVQRGCAERDPREGSAHQCGALSALDLTRRGVSGRLISVTLTGDLGTKTVSGDVFRAAFNAGRPTTDPADPEHAVRRGAGSLSHAIAGPGIVAG